MAAMLAMSPWVRAWKTRFHPPVTLAHAVAGVASRPAMVSAATAATNRSLILAPVRIPLPRCEAATAPATPAIIPGERPPGKEVSPGDLHNTVASKGAATRGDRGAAAERSRHQGPGRRAQPRHHTPAPKN